MSPPADLPADLPADPPADPPADLRGFTLRGPFRHAPAPDRVERLDDALVALDGTGAIASVTPSDHPEHGARAAHAARAGTLARVPAGHVALPGFVDAHLHAPQHPQRGMALDLPLERWLQDRTFPLEARFADLAFAREAYAALVADLLAGGTTTAMMFATIHHDATLLLARLCAGAGLRALIGRVAMDCAQGCPDFYRDPSPEAAVEGTRRFLDAAADLPGGLTQGVVTPRFIPACTDAALAGLGRLARETGAAVQTHCSESDWQHAHVRARTGRSDAEALDGFGLLGPRTVLAHAPFLSEADMDLVAARGAAVAHCPLSNAYFAGAVFPLRAAMARGVRVALGTDVSGGPDTGMVSALRMTVVASRMLESGVDPALPPERRGRPGSAVDWRTAFHLATAGGGAALGLPVGTFAPGMRFDALFMRAPDGPAPPGADADAALARLLHGAQRDDVAAVYVDGVRRATRGALVRA